MYVNVCICIKKIVIPRYAYIHRYIHTDIHTYIVTHIHTPIHTYLGGFKGLKDFRS